MGDDGAQGGRRIYLIPLVFELKDPPEGYAEKLDAYWQETADHVRRLETRFGQVRKIFHESLPAGGDEGLRAIERSSPRAHRVIDRKCKLGAELVAVEDPVVLQEAYDWGACLSIVASPSVQEKVGAFYHAANQKRRQIMEERIDQNLNSGEAALLVVGLEHALRFPQDVEVFYVSPPSLDEVRRLLREHVNRVTTQDSDAGD